MHVPSATRRSVGREIGRGMKGVFTNRKSNGVVWSQVVIASLLLGINFDNIIRETMDAKIANTIQMQRSYQSF
jgi:hypothetical protein